MPAGLFLKKSFTIQSKSFIEIPNVNGFVGIYNSWSSNVIILHWASSGEIYNLINEATNYIDLSFKEDNTTLVITNNSEQNRPITIFYQNLKV